MSDVEISASGDVTQLIAAMEKGGKSVNSMADDIKKAGQSGSSAMTAAGSKIEHAAEGIESKFKAVGAGLVGALALDKVKDAFANSLDLEAGQAKLNASLDLTQKQSAAAGKAAGQVFAGNYGDSMEDVQDAVGTVMGTLSGMKDANASTVSAMTAKLFNLRSAFGTDVADSSQAAAQLMKTGMAKNADEAVDLLTAGLQKVPKAMRENLLDATNEYAPYLKGLGFSGQEMFGILSKAAEGGEIQVDKAGDALKEFGIRATDGSKTSAQAFKAAGLGKEMHSLSNDLLAGGDRSHDAFQKIVKGLRDIDDPSKRAQAAIGLFGTPLEDVSVQDVPKFLDGLSGAGKGMGDVAGAADRMGKKLSDTNKNSIETVQRGMQGFVNDLTKLPGPLGESASAAAALGPTAITAGAGLVTMVMGAGQLTKALNLQKVATGIATAAQWLFNAALDANPIGIIILAITALVAGLVWFFTQTKAGQAAWSAFMSFLAQAWTNIVKVASDVWSAVSGAFASGVKVVQDVIGAVVGWIRSNWQLLVGIFLGPIGLVVALVVSNFDKIQAFIAGAITGVRTVITNVLNAVGSFISSAFNAYRTVAVAVWTAILTAVQTALAGVRAVVNTVVGWVSGFISAEVRGWQLIFTAVWTAIKNATSTVFGAVRGVVSGVINSVSDFITGFTSGVIGTWRAGWSAIVSAVTSIFGRIVAGVSGVIGRVTDVVGGIAGKVRGAIGDAGSILLGIGKSIIDGLVSGIRGAVGAVQAVVHNVINSIPEAARKLLGIASPSKVFIQIARFIGEGLVKGLQGSKDDVIAAMTDLVQKIQDAPKKAFKGGGAAKSALLRSLEADTAALKKLAADRDAVIKQMDDAQARLDDAKKQRDDYSYSVYGGLASQATATSATGQKDADGNMLAVTTADVIAAKQNTINKTQKFLQDVEALKKAGLNREDYKAIVDSFQQNGDTTLADTLVAAGPEAIRQINDLNNAFQDAAGSLADETSARLYQGGVDAAQAQLKALQDQRDAITGGIGAIESAMADQLKQVGIDSSALATQAGKDIALGLANGAKSNKKLLEDTFEDLGASMVKAIKKKLKIKSPSKVADEEVGQMFGLGAVQGVVKTYGKMEDAVSGLVKVPTLSPANVAPQAAAQAAVGYTGVGAASAEGGQPIQVTIAVPPKADRDDVQYAEDMMGAVRFGVSAAVGGGVNV